jgi:hypothetical protein
MIMNTCTNQLNLILIVIGTRLISVVAVAAIAAWSDAWRSVRHYYFGTALESSIDLVRAVSYRYIEQQSSSPLILNRPVNALRHIPRWRKVLNYWMSMVGYL